MDAKPAKCTVMAARLVAIKKQFGLYIAPVRSYTAPKPVLVLCGGLVKVVKEIRYNP